MTFVVDIYDPQRMNNVGAPLMFPLVTPAGGHFQKYSQKPSRNGNHVEIP